MGLPNTKIGNLKNLERRIRRLERANPLSSSSLGRGRMRFYDGSVLLIENGALNVTGTATIAGTLDVTGTTNLKGQTSVTGPMEISGTTNITGNTNVIGELNVTGPTTLDGDTEVGGTIDVTGAMSTKGTLSVEGVTTLKNDLNVEAGGKIKAGNVEIDPAAGGTIRTLNGSIFDDGQIMQILSPNGIQLTGIATSILSPEIHMTSLPVKLGAEPNLHIDANKQLWVCG